MAFHGLFVGIDRYASSDVSWLTCACRDATALHALFTDTLGPGGILLTDEEATRVRIEAEFQLLFATTEDDVVVLAFSGHGSDTHELATYDADLSDLPGTCIPLETLGQWFRRIPARRLLCILDCCFSGGMEAKVLHAAAAPRSMQSAECLLKEMSGDGRLILTASKATEPAWEDRRHGHGFLTYYLLEALQGAEEIRQAGKIAVYRLLEYVTQRVIDAAAQIGQPQHPTIRGQIDGELTWPMFSPGERYRKAFPERAGTPVTAELASLTAHGFPPHILDAWARSIPGLNALQLDAINEFGLLGGDHLVVSAPTSSGKTMIGELAALRGTIDRQRAIFLLPLKALVNDKHRQFTALYGPGGLRVLRATGDYTADTTDLLRGRYDICLMTYEKFANLVLVAPHLLRQVGVVVIDEVQMIADRNRGTTVEFLLTVLRMRRRQGIEPQVIALSAVIGDTNGLERWLGARLLLRTERPVPLDEGILTPDGTFRYVDLQGQEQQIEDFSRPQWGDGKHRDWVIPLVRRLVMEGQQVIVFRETKGEARHCARYLATALGLPAAQNALDALPTGDPSTASGELREFLHHGVAFHVADLAPDERTVVETYFRDPYRSIRVIAATTTLAMGVNTPASAIVIVGLEHPANQPYTVAEYKNIVGRAGRLGHVEKGTSYLIATTAQEEHRYWNRYVRGTPEELESHFFSPGTDPRSLVLRVLVAARTSEVEGMTAEDVIDFLEGSFAAFRARQSASNWRYSHDELVAALQNLEGHMLIERADQGGLHLTELGRICGESGLQVESIVRLVDALRALPPDRISTATLITATQCTVELDDVLFPINKKSTQKEPQTWFSELQRQNVPDNVLQMLHRVVQEKHDAATRAKKAVACLLWMTDRPLLEMERILTQFGGALGGAAGAIQAVTSRTFDIIPTVGQVAAVLHPGLDLADKVRQIMVRLELGLPASLVELASHVRTRLARGDYLRLGAAGLNSIDALESAADEAILDSVGGSEEKLAELRRGVQSVRRARTATVPLKPILPPPED